MRGVGFGNGQQLRQCSNIFHHAKKPCLVFSFSQVFGYKSRRQQEIAIARLVVPLHARNMINPVVIQHVRAKLTISGSSICCTACSGNASQPCSTSIDNRRDGQTLGEGYEGLVPTCALRQ